MWRAAARRLGDRYEVIRPDLPGFASAGGSFSIDRAADAVIDVAQAPPARAHLVGYSLGGPVAVRAAVTRPELFLSLVLVASPVAPGRYQPRLVRRYRRIPDRLAVLFSDARSWRALVDEVRKIDIEADLGRISTPTLVVCGSRDRGSLPDSRRLAGAVPGARLVVLPHLGHGFPVMAPKVLAAVLDAFYGGLAGPGPVRRSGS